MYHDLLTEKVLTLKQMTKYKTSSQHIFMLDTLYGD
jgi:hypothetical protein